MDERERRRGDANPGALGFGIGGPAEAAELGGRYAADSDADFTADFNADFSADLDAEFDADYGFTLDTGGRQGRRAAPGVPGGAAAAGSGSE